MNALLNGLVPGLNVRHNVSTQCTSKSRKQLPPASQKNMARANTCPHTTCDATCDATSVYSHDNWEEIQLQDFVYLYIQYCHVELHWHWLKKQEWKACCIMEWNKAKGYLYDRRDLFRICNCVCMHVWQWRWVEHLFSVLLSPPLIFLSSPTASKLHTHFFELFQNCLNVHVLNSMSSTMKL